MTDLITIFETIGCMGVSIFVYWVYLFYSQQLLISNDKYQEKEPNIVKDKEKEIVKEIKYDDKYLEKFNTLENVFSFQEEDINIKTIKMNELLELNKEEIEKIEEFEQTANEYMIQHFLSRLKNSYIIENTPLGNVAMNFNNTKGSFEYYSDKNMPYRFLETIARKYVITFHCKPLYINMDTEIELAKTKMKEEKEKEKENLILNQNKPKTTKDIFANFKNIQSIQANQSSKSKNTTTNTRINPTHTQKPGAHILKENANRYTHMGKISNFILLKAVDKSNHDKNAKLSYREFRNRSKNF